MNTTRRRRGCNTVNPHRAEMIELRKQGITLAAIGKRFGLTRARVHQITVGIPASPTKHNGMAHRNPRAYQQWRRLENFPKGRCAQWSTVTAFAPFFDSLKIPRRHCIEPADKSRPCGPSNFSIVRYTYRSKINIKAFGESKSISAWSRDPRCRVGKITLQARLRRYRWNPEIAITAKQHGYYHNRSKTRSKS